MLTVLTLLLSGCIDAPPSDDAILSDDGSDETADAGDGDASGDTSATEEPEDEDTATDDLAPEDDDPEPVDEAVTVQPVLTIDGSSGDGPLTTRITVDVAGDHDSVVRWSLDGDGDGVDEVAGRTLPYSNEYTFTSWGTYTATFTVDDGSEVQRLTRDITVASPGTAVPGDTPDTSDDDAGSPEETLPTLPPEEDPPTVVADLITSTETGEAPLPVSFSINASGAPVTAWHLDTDGDGTPDANGTSVPAQYDHEYSVPGTYVATLNVSAGDLFDEAKVTIVVLDTPSAPEIHFEETLQTACQDCETELPIIGCVGLISGQTGVDCAYWQLEDSEVGRSYTTTTTTSDTEAVFLDACDARGTRIDDDLGEGDAAGTVPDGAGCLMVWAYNGPGGVETEHTVTATIFG